MTHPALFLPALVVLFTCASGAYADSLLIKGTIPGEEVVVMANARDASGSSCLQGGDPKGWVMAKITLDASPSPRGSFDMGNLKQGCVLDVAVFSKNHSVLFKTQMKGWTDNPAQVRTVTLRRPINVRVQVWIADPDPGAETTARHDFASTHDLYLARSTGIQLKPVFKTVAPGDVQMIRDGINTIPQCLDLAPIRQSRYYRKKSLNVYYVDDDLLGGRNCALMTTPDQCDCTDVDKGDGNITFIGRLPLDFTTLAHELGHALGLRPGDDDRKCGGHTKESEFPRNVMNTGAGQRDHFTLGQVFRMNTDKGAPSPDTCGGSKLVENGNWTGPVRACKPMMYDELCPPLNADPPQ